MPQRVISSIDEFKSLAGTEVGASDWLEITQDRVNAFAEATLDPQWIHIDPERAKRESPFGGPIAHGFLTLSLLPEFAHQAYRVDAGFKLGVNYGLNKLRFTSPVPVGSRIRARFALQSVEDHDWGVQSIWIVTVDIEDRPKPALVAEWISRAYY